ncbi:signal peptidase I [Archaeoglobus sp.]|uniref:signal peptidase I n=1 Tax=Archaeoglobus sp. TaxID=1872626 RepID=UPI0024AA75A7|nr:signal peptidase I [Archaeoglobus sp.]MDI3498668.1 signal peptidase [Archaeoglobus sp.]
MLTPIALLIFAATPFLPSLLSFYGKIPAGIFLAFSAYHEAKSSGIPIFRKPLRLKNFQSPVNLAIYAASLQIIILFTLGVFLGFGKSPYSFTPLGIATNFAYVTSTLVGVELSRALVVRKLGDRAVIVVSTLYFFLLYLSDLRFLPTAPLEILKFLGNDVIPHFTQQLFLTLLAYVYGFRASIAFIFPVTAFEWFCPILPNLDWTLNAMMKTAVPAAGYAILEKELEPKRVEVKKENTLSWVGFLTACILLLLFFSGSFGYHPSVVGSGSMRPAIEVGDVVIVKKVSADEIRVGDVIQYYAEHYTVTHRVVDIMQRGEQKIFITKGDANDVVDDPVSADRVVGKVVFVIPRIGLVTLMLRDLLKMWGVLP